MSTDSRFGLVIQRLALVMLAAVALIVTHKFSRTVGRAPALAFDDSLAGVSANLAREGRLGFDAIPVNTLSLAAQNQHFFNYGPWYFVFAAALDWLFGTSYEVHRWAHLLGILASIGFAWMFFRERDRSMATAIYGCGALLSFHYHQWPMVRPDIVGVAFACLALVFARKMVTEGGWGPGFGFGLSIGIALTNHPIVAALGPWSFAVVVALSVFREPSHRWRSVVTLVLPWACGLATAGLGLVIGSGFRPGAILKLYFLYPSFVQKVGPTTGFVESIDRHLSFIGLSPGTAQTLAAGLLIVVLADVFTYFRRPNLDAWITLLPGSAGAAYLLSLGVFHNTHEGYGVLVQVLFVWTTTAWVIRMSRGLAMGAGVAVPAAALIAVTSAPGRWERAAADNVPYQEYIDAVRENIPADAYVQGEAVFGLGRPNWVEMAHAAVLTEEFRPGVRNRLTPDFLVISEPQWMAECLQAQSNAEPRLLVPSRPAKGPAVGGFFNQVPWLFGNHSFRLLRIASGAPYGSTHVYQRQGSEVEAAGLGRPEVMVWSPPDQWRRRVGEQGTPFSPALPLVLRLSKESAFNARRAIESRSGNAWEATLEPGSYLIEVLGAHAAKVAGCVVASASAVITSTSEVQAAAPRLPAGLRTHLVVEHRGGLLRVALLSLGSAEEEAISRVTAFRIADPLVASGLRGATETYPAALLRCRNNPKAFECSP